MRRLPKSHCRAVAPIRLPKVSLIKVNTCCHRETAGPPSVLLPGINHMNGLNHAHAGTASPYRLGASSQQTVEAQPYFNVSQASLVLEGIVFDRNNNLLFVDVATGRVFKLTPERQLSIVLKENSFGASGWRYTKMDGSLSPRWAICSEVLFWAIGQRHREQMIVADTGFLVNDLVFDNQGGFYFTDSREIQPIHRVGCSTLVPMSGQFMPSCTDSRSGTA